ncbi:MAG: PAS domain S-box protein [Acidobacteria bacterium]|nr:PAS domain S-box protein [Acidobacteriota bacterium]
MRSEAPISREARRNEDSSSSATAQTVAPDFRSIFEASPLAIVSYSLDRRVRAWNPMAERLFGWKAHEIIGEIVPVPESEMQQWRELHENLAQGKPFINVETRRLRKDGSVFDVIASGAPTYDSAGQVNGFISVLGDANQVLRIERALEASEQRRLLALQAAEMGSWSWDLQTNIVDWDATCKSIFGMPQTTPAVSFENFFQLLHPEDRMATRDAVLRAVTERRDYDMVHRVNWPNGEVHWIRCKGRLDSKSSPRCLVGVSVNADWIKRNEELFRAKERLDAAAQVAFELSHEINNPMEILCNTLYLIQHEMGEGHYAVQAANEAFSRVSAISRQLLALHASPGSVEPVNLAMIANQVIEQFARKVQAKSVTVEMQLSTLETLGSYTNIRHIFTRLLENALDSIGSNGRLVIRVHVARDWSCSEVQGVKILVADNGPGISEDLQRKLFGPFVSTKTTKGAGLGLWVCKTLAAKCGGSIRLRSSTKPGRSGTCVCVFLPEGRPQPTASANAKEVTPQATPLSRRRQARAGVAGAPAAAM